MNSSRLANNTAPTIDPVSNPWVREGLSSFLEQIVGELQGTLARVKPSTTGNKFHLNVDGNRDSSSLLEVSYSKESPGRAKANQNPSAIFDRKSVDLTACYVENKKCVLVNACNENAPVEMIDQNMRTVFERIEQFALQVCDATQKEDVQMAFRDIYATCPQKNNVTEISFSPRVVNALFGRVSGAPSFVRRPEGISLISRLTTGLMPSSGDPKPSAAS